MSELINARANQGNLRWQLLTTVSAASFLIALSALGDAAAAEDTNRPTVWIELGGQLEAISGGQELFTPPFVTKNMDMPLNAISPTSVERAPNYAIGGEGKISFAPKDSDWEFSAAIRYGRSNQSKHALHQQTSTKFKQKALKYNPADPKFSYRSITRFNDATAKQSESHAILDFMVGKDVGLGLFGQGSTSVVGLGVRFAQFHSEANAGFLSNPVRRYGIQFAINDPQAYHISYAATSNLGRSFRGVGPSLAWNGSTPFVGNPDTGELTFDWGANVAALFGRQKVRGSHLTTGIFFHGSPLVNGGPPTSHYNHLVPVARSHSAVVPNIGGFAGISFKFPNAKVSLGYRADFFFGAMDGGIDMRKSEMVGFHGPFATVSIGLGG